MKENGRTYNENEDWQGLLEVELKKSSPITTLVNKFKSIRGTVWCTQFAVCLLAWLTDLQASNNPLMYLTTIAVLVIIPWVHCRQ